MDSAESKTLKKGDKIDMIVTGGSGRVYKGEVLDANEIGLSIRWDDGEQGFIEHIHADYLQKSNSSDGSKLHDKGDDAFG
jgi:hypothetical protein